MAVAFELRDSGDQFGVRWRIARGDGLRQHGVGDDQFADQVDQLIDFIDADANRRFGLLVADTPFGNLGGTIRSDGGRRGTGCRIRRQFGEQSVTGIRFVAERWRTDSRGIDEEAKAVLVSR